MHKLENSARLAELSPPETLARLDFIDGMTFADIGAGTGIFTTAAAEITHSQVWAIDPSASMREILESKKSALALGNVGILSDVSALAEQTVDLALLCTVLHEIDGQEAFLTQIAGRLKPAGRLAVIEFHKYQTLYGPPPAIRISPEDVLRLAASAGLCERERFTLGESYDCLVLQKDNA
ncbi:MAG: methyltransferase domain-containing protein [Clostridiaceae bacterium]